MYCGVRRVGIGIGGFVSVGLGVFVRGGTAVVLLLFAFVIGFAFIAELFIAVFVAIFAFSIILAFIISIYPLTSPNLLLYFLQIVLISTHSCTSARLPSICHDPFVFIINRSDVVFDPILPISVFLFNFVKYCWFKQGFRAVWLGFFVYFSYLY